MKKFYYLFSLLLAGAMTLSLAACGNDDDDKNLPGDNGNSQENTNGVDDIDFEVVAINGKGYYNCVKGQFYTKSTLSEEESFRGWKDTEVKESSVLFLYHLYQSISEGSKCNTQMEFRIPKSSLQEGKDITNDLLFAFIETEMSYFWGGTASDHVDDAPVVTSGSIKITSRTNDKVTLQFNNVSLLERKLDKITNEQTENTVTINGSITCENYRQ